MDSRFDARRVGASGHFRRVAQTFFRNGLCHLAERVRKDVWVAQPREVGNVVAVALAASPRRQFPEHVQHGWLRFVRGTVGATRDTLYWHYPLTKPHFLGRRSSGAIRRGDWKLIEYFNTGKLELYNLAGDIGEKNDRSASMPEKVKQLHAKLKA